jgi:hypothetical protein
VVRPGQPERVIADAPDAHPDVLAAGLAAALERGEDLDAALRHGVAAAARTGWCGSAQLPS